MKAIKIMQILKLTPNAVPTTNYRNNNYTNQFRAVSKNNVTFKGGMEQEISSAIIKNLADNPDLKNIFANSKMKETFMECLASTMVLVAAKITQMVCGESTAKDKVINGDVFVKNGQNACGKAQQQTAQGTKEPETNTVNYTKEQVKEIIVNNCAKELELLKRESFIQEHKDNAYYGYLNQEHVHYKADEEGFANALITKLEKFQEKLISDKPNEKVIDKFVRNLDDNMANEYVTVAQPDSEKIKELLEESMTFIKGMYIDKICKKVSSNLGATIPKNLIEELVAEETTKTNAVKKEEPLKELPKTHGKHSKTEYSLIEYMESYKSEVPLYNKFVDAYTKYCGFNRNGITSVNGKDVQNADIAKKLYDDLTKSTDKSAVEETLDYYLAGMAEKQTKKDIKEDAQDTKATNKVKGTKDVKKKSEPETEEIGGRLAEKLSKERCVDANLSKELSLDEKLERSVAIIKKEVELDTRDLLLNSAALPEHYGRKEKMYLLRAIRDEISSRKNHPYKNLDKITQSELVGLISQGNFNPKVYNVHSALRFIDRFVLENISNDDLERVDEIMTEKIRVFDNAVNSSMNGHFKIYADYHDGYYGIQIPILPSKLSKQEKLDYQRCFGDQNLLLTIDASSYIHTITMFEKK